MELCTKAVLRRVMMSSKPGAVAYLRVSSREQEREGYSIAAQRKLLRQ